MERAKSKMVQKGQNGFMKKYYRKIFTRFRVKFGNNLRYDLAFLSRNTDPSQKFERFYSC